MRVRIRRFGKLRFPKRGGPECSGSLLIDPVYLRCVVLSRFTLPSNISSAEADIWSTGSRFVACTLLSVRPFATGAVHYPRGPSLLRPLLTSRSAVDKFPRRHPFRHEARSPQVRLIGCPCTSAGFTKRLFGRESFAVIGPLALSRPACYPVSVRRPTGLATPLLSALPSRSAPCGSLGSLRPTPQRTSTS